MVDIEDGSIGQGLAESYGLGLLLRDSGGEMVLVSRY